PGPSILREGDEPALEVVVIAGAHGLGGPDVGAETPDLARIAEKEVTGVAGARRQLRHGVYSGDDAIDLAVAIERRPPPRRREIPPLDELPARGAKALDGPAVRIAPGAAAQRPPDAFRRVLERLLEPEI